MDEVLFIEEIPFLRWWYRDGYSNYGFKWITRIVFAKKREELPTSFSSDRILRDLSSSLLVQKGRKDKSEKLPLYCVLQTLAMHRHGRPLSVSEIPSASVFQFPNKVSMNVTDDTGISLVCLCREITDDGCFLSRRRWSTMPKDECVQFSNYSNFKLIPLMILRCDRDRRLYVMMSSYSSPTRQMLNINDYFGNLSCLLSCL